MAGYDPNLDQIVGSISETCITGKQQQNAFFVFIRSYNGGPGKIEFNRHQPNQQYPNMKKSIRLESAEFEFILKHASQIRQMLANTGAQIQQPMCIPIEQRQHPEMLNQGNNQNNQNNHNNYNNYNNFAPQGNQQPPFNGFPPFQQG